MGFLNTYSANLVELFIYIYIFISEELYNVDIITQEKCLKETWQGIQLRIFINIRIVISKIKDWCMYPARILG